MRLQNLETDERGIGILSTAEPFELSASHRDLGERSAGLALYFDTIMHFMILMFLLLFAGGGARRGARRPHFSSTATCQL